MTLETIVVEGFRYSHTDRLEFDMIIPIEPTSRSDDVLRLAAYARTKINETAFDVKHSFKADCRICGQPAQENFYDFTSRLDRPPQGTMWMGEPSPGPKVYVHISALCSIAGACGERTRALGLLNALQSVAMGFLPENIDIDTEIHAPATFPRNGSCLICHAETGEPLKCQVCKLTQYCSEACQKEDMPRHQRICEWFTGVRVVNRNGTTTVWK